jgi:uncharacterized membrane protein YesL
MSRVVEELKLGFKTLVDTAKMLYGHLGIVIMASVFWFLFVAPLLSLVYGALNLPGGYPVVIGLPALMLTFPFTAASLYVINCAYHKEDVNLFSFFRGLKRFFFRALGVGAIYLIVFSIILYDLYFFMFLQTGIIFQIIGALWFWVAVYAVFVAYYVLGFLVEQDTGVIKSIKRSALVVLDNVFFSFVVTLMFMIAGGLSLIIPVALIFSGGMIAYIIQNSTATILKRYDAFEFHEGEYGSMAEHPEDTWEGLPDPRENPDFYGMSEEEVKQFQDKRRRRRRRISLRDEDHEDEGREQGR